MNLPLEPPNISLEHLNTPVQTGQRRNLPGLNVRPAVPEGNALWEITLCLQDTQDAAWRGLLLEQMRTAIEKKLEEEPSTHRVQLNTALGTVEACRSGKPGSPSAPVRLAFGARELAPSSPRASYAANAPAPLPTQVLPDPHALVVGARLVGLDEIRRDLLLRWACLWDGGLEAWSAQTGCAAPLALVACLRQSHALSIFHGDPGVGKTALARAAATEYCTTHGITGTLLSVTTEARGEGLVGQFSQRLRAAFEQLRLLPESGLRVLLLDEADSVAIRRSEAQSHQEDRAATATVLQMLDALVGQRRLAIIMTTNLASSIDSAIKRRAHLVAFPRPGLEARLLLLAPWLPGVRPSDLEQAARAADNMTPADIEQALLRAWLAAVSQNGALAPLDVVTVLKAAERTEAV